MEQSRDIFYSLSYHWGRKGIGGGGEVGWRGIGGQMKLAWLSTLNTFSVLSFVAVTILACSTAERAILAFIFMPVLLPVMYCIMQKKHDKFPAVTKATKHEGVKYTPLNTSPDEELHVSSETKAELSVRDKVDAIWKALPFTLTLTTAYFSFFLTLQSVVTTLAFPDAPFGPRNHYIFYTFAVMMGNLTGRTYALILEAINQDCRPFTRHTGFSPRCWQSFQCFLCLVPGTGFLRACELCWYWCSSLECWLE